MWRHLSPLSLSTISTAPWVPTKTVLIITQSPLLRKPAKANADAVIHTKSFRDVSFNSQVSINPLCSAITSPTATSRKAARQARPRPAIATSLPDDALRQLRPIHQVLYCVLSLQPRGQPHIQR